MGKVSVNFKYYTGLYRVGFSNVYLHGSWDKDGLYSDTWSEIKMKKYKGYDGCESYIATVSIDDSQMGWKFHWGVKLDDPSGKTRWGIATEVDIANSDERTRTFVLESDGQDVEYYLTNCRHLGANKFFVDGYKGIRFAVWAPNAKAVEVVLGDQKNGYISDAGEGMTSKLGDFPMHKGADGIWYTDINDNKLLQDFEKFRHTPYMFRITKDDGSVAYRTDIYSRCQIGSGNVDPNEEGFAGKREALDGTVSCSVVVDPEKIAKYLSEPNWPELTFIDEKEFWADEYRDKKIPTRLEDMVIYEMHIGGLGYGTNRIGNLSDAIKHLDYLVELGVNAVEIMPLNEFEGWGSWGYGTSHFFAIEYSGGGRDQFKHFVRECHRHGIAVILDVVYNHYHHNSERAEWFYDSNSNEKNIYYWYEGKPEDYPAYEAAAKINRERTTPGHGGYIDNMSTGYAPRYSEEIVRKMFISSAASIMNEFHVDAFRVDQTTSIHSYAVLHANGKSADRAKEYGIKFLREWTRTLHLIKPDAILIAEDHSGWSAVTTDPDEGGLGFDAVWYADFYHHLIGDTDKGSDYAKLIKTAGLGGDGALAMDYFAGVLKQSERSVVVYSESHDEAGNSQDSGRTITVAVNRYEPLEGEVRSYAEARSRFAFGMNILSAATPMFFMGEEVGHKKNYRYNDFWKNRESFEESKDGEGKHLFHFYSDLIKLRLSDENEALRCRNIDILDVNNSNRVIVFRRCRGKDEFMVIASLNNRAFENGYVINSPLIQDSEWDEVFNSDSANYGGNNVGNGGSSIHSSNGNINVTIPHCGFVVLRKKAA